MMGTAYDRKWEADIPIPSTGIRGLRDRDIMYLGLRRSTFI